MDEVVVQIGAALGALAIALEERAQPFARGGGHRGVGLPLAFAQLHRLAVELKVALGLAPALFERLLLPHEFLGLPAHGRLRDEEAVEHAVEGRLLLSGLGVHGAQRGLDARAIVPCREP